MRSVLCLLYHSVCTCCVDKQICICEHDILHVWTCVDMQYCMLPSLMHHAILHLWACNIACVLQVTCPQHSSNIHATLPWCCGRHPLIFSLVRVYLPIRFHRSWFHLTIFHCSWSHLTSSNTPPLLHKVFLLTTHRQCHLNTN